MLFYTVWWDQLQFDSNEELIKFCLLVFLDCLISYTIAISSVKVVALDANARNLALKSIFAFVPWIVVYGGQKIELARKNLIHPCKG